MNFGEVLELAYILLFGIPIYLTLSCIKIWIKKKNKKIKKIKKIKNKKNRQSDDTCSDYHVNSTSTDYN